MTSNLYKIEKHNNMFTLFLILISIFSLILTAYLIMYPKNFEDRYPFHNVIVGATFVSVCFTGSIASIYPNPCGKILSSKMINNSNKIHFAKKLNFQGHHYPCEKYSNHTLKTGKKYFCATCSGLLFGAILGIIGSIWYFSGYFPVERISILAPLAMISVFFGLFQSVLPKMKRALPRFFAGKSLVTGAFILLASLDQVINSTFIDLFYVLISMFWVLTKINLSQREHRLTCLNCPKKHCDLDKKFMG